MNNISFQGATNFTISPTAYKKVEATTRKAYTNLTRKSNCKLEGHKICALDTAPEYLTVIVRNDNNNGLFRYIPIKPNIQETIDDLSKQVEHLKDSAKGTSLTAWIVGGTRLNTPKGCLITTVLDEIAKIICEKPKIDTSILVGSKTGEEKFIMRAGKSDFKLALDKKVNPDNDLESELGKIFDIVELNNTELIYAK